MPARALADPAVRQSAHRRAAGLARRCQRPAWPGAGRRGADGRLLADAGLPLAQGRVQRCTDGRTRPGRPGRAPGQRMDGVRRLQPRRSLFIGRPDHAGECRPLGEGLGIPHRRSAARGRSRRADQSGHAAQGGRQIVHLHPAQHCHRAGCRYRRGALAFRSRHQCGCRVLPAHDLPRPGLSRRHCLRRCRDSSRAAGCTCGALRAPAVSADQ